MKRNPTIILALLIIILFSCKKEVDENLPQIQISLPYENATFGYQDEIRIKATVTDDVNLERIEVKVTSSTGQVYFNSINYINSGKSKTIDTFITHNDFYIETGTYYITIVAFDGINEKIEFSPIQVIESPRQLLYPMVIFNGNVYDTQVEKLDGSNFSFLFGLNLNYNQSTFDSRNQLFHIAGNGLLSSFIQNPAVLISSTQVNTTVEGTVITSFHDEETNDSYFATSDGGIWKTDVSAQPGLVVSQSGTFRARDLLVANNKIMALENNLDGSQSRISVYNKFSGTLEQSVVVPNSFDVKKIIDIGETNFFIVIGNSGGQSLFQYYNLDTSALINVPNNYNSVAVDNAWPGQDGSFYVSHGTQLTTYSNNMQNWFSGIYMSALKVVYEENSNTNYVLTTTGLNQLDSGLGTLLSFTPAFYQPLDLHLVYDK